MGLTKLGSQATPPERGPILARDVVSESRRFSSKALLRQPGGFDGFVLGEEAASVDDLSGAEGVEGSAGLMHSRAAVVPANPELIEHEDAIAEVSELGVLELHLREARRQEDSQDLPDQGCGQHLAGRRGLPARARLSAGTDQDDPPGDRRGVAARRGGGGDSQQLRASLQALRDPARLSPGARGAGAAGTRRAKPSRSPPPTCRRWSTAGRRSRSLPPRSATRSSPYRAIYRRAKSRGGLPVKPTRDLELPAPRPREVEIVSPEAASRLSRPFPPRTDWSGRPPSMPVFATGS